MIVNLSLSIRIAINAEALNMAEAVGNYTRHRKAPVVIASDGGYSIIYVPAVSGESLAYSYQAILARITKDRNLPVTKMDELGYFLKFADDNVLGWYEEDLKRVIGENSVQEWIGKASVSEIERAILKASVVADVGGFLYTSKQVKRTSAIRFSYMLPTIDTIEKGGVAVTPQLHVRYAPPEPRERARDAQKLFYLESGSALYTFTAQLTASNISKLYYSDKDDDELKNQKSKRVEVAVDALIALVDGALFGARRSRYQPQWDVKSLVVAVSKGPIEFIVSPGLTRDYINKTYSRAVSLCKAIQEESIDIYVFNGEGLEEPSTVQKTEEEAASAKVTYDNKIASHTEALVKAKSEILSIIKDLQ